MTSLRAARISLAVICSVCALAALLFAAVFYRAELAPVGRLEAPDVKLRVAIGLVEAEKSALDRLLGKLDVAALPDAPRSQHPAFEFSSGVRAIDARFQQIRADMEAQREEREKTARATEFLRRLQDLGEPAAGYRSPRFYRALALSWAGNPKEALSVLDSFRARSGVGHPPEVAAMKEYVAYLRTLLEFQARLDLGRYLANLDEIWKRIGPDAKVLAGMGLVEPGELRTELLVVRVRRAAAEKSASDRERAYESAGAAWKARDSAASKVQSDAAVRREEQARCALILRLEDFADFPDSSCEQVLSDQSETNDMIRFRRSARDGRPDYGKLTERFQVHRVALLKHFHGGASGADRGKIAGYLLRHPSTPWYTKLELKPAGVLTVAGLVALALLILGLWAFLDSEMRRVFAGAPRLDEQV